MSDPKSPEAARLDLDLRKQALDESFPKKWGTVLFSAMATVSVALITGGLGWMQSDRQRNDSREAAAAAKTEKSAAATLAEGQRTIDNDRLALNIFFDKLNGEVKTVEDADKRHVLGTIAGSPKVKSFFESIAVKDNVALVQSGPKNVDPSQKLQGAPDLTADKKPAQYLATDFVAYLQVGDAEQAAAEPLRQALIGQGFKVPAVQVVAANKVPSRNQIRIYREEHRALAANIAARLKTALHADFAIVPVHVGRALPNGVMEFWIGRGAAPAAT